MEQNLIIKRNKDYCNSMRIDFDSISENEALSRMIVSAFVMPLDPTMEELNDLKTAVSEAVTNAIIHGYESQKGSVHIECEMRNNIITVVISDKGKGIENIEQAMEPLYTSKPDSGRAGMGFVLMEAFMDSLNVESVKGIGTTVTMTKIIGRQWQE